MFALSSPYEASARQLYIPVLGSPGQIDIKIHVIPTYNWGKVKPTQTVLWLFTLWPCVRAGDTQEQDELDGS